MSVARNLGDYRDDLVDLSASPTVMFHLAHAPHDKIREVIGNLAAPHARYAVLHLGGDAVQVEMLAIAYDWEAAARRAEEIGFNAAWPHVIRTGLLPESA